MRTLEYELKADAINAEEAESFISTTTNNNRLNNEVMKNLRIQQQQQQQGRYPRMFMAGCCVVLSLVLLVSTTSKARVVDPSSDSSTRSSSSSSSSSSGPSEHHSFDTATDFCQAMQMEFGSGMMNAPLSIWTQFYDRITPVDQVLMMDELLGKQEMVHQQAVDVLNFITPRLPRSIVSMPRDAAKVQRILQKGLKRYQWLKHAQRDSLPEPPVVSIVVVGGSVPCGRRCGKFKETRLECAWPTRLEQVLNQVFGFEAGQLVVVQNKAVSASNTQVSQVILEYGLLPDNMDILINSHATNDMFLANPMSDTRDPKFRSSQSYVGKPLEEEIFDTAQSYIRTVLDPDLCQNRHRDTPLLLWLDDYLGQHEKKVKQTFYIYQQISALAYYYGIPFVSYPNTVREVIYQDTVGTTEAFKGLAADMSNGNNDPHPGYLMHMAMSYILAYNFLNMATTHCTLQQVWKPLTTSTDTFKDLLPPTFPVPLTEELSMTTISDEMNAPSTRQCLFNHTKPCAFTWIRGVTGPNEQKELQSFFEPYVHDRGDWFIPDEKVLGWIPTETGQVTRPLVFRFRVEQPIRSITMVVMQSYGSKWENSRAAVTIASRRFGSDGDWQVQPSSFEMEGSHDKQTSELIPLHWNLPSEILQESEVEISFYLTGGTTFKLSGMTLCSVAWES